MTTNDMLDEVQRIATKLYGVGIGVQYREHKTNEHTLVLYRSRYKDGNINLEKEQGYSYHNVAEKLYKKLKTLEELAAAKLSPPVVILTSGTHTHEDADQRLSSDEVEGEHYCYSEDGDEWFGDEPSELRAFIAGSRELQATTLWIAQREEPNVRDFLHRIADAVIAQLQGGATELSGRGDEWLEEFSTTDLDSLDEAVSAAVIQWLGNNNRLPSFFGVSDAQVKARAQVQLIPEGKEEVKHV